LSGRGLCDELITRPEESYRLWCVVVCDLETSRMGAPYIYDISNLRSNDLTFILLTWRKWWAPNNASRQQMGFNSGFKELRLEKSSSLAVQYHFLDVHFWKTKISVNPEYDTCVMFVQMPNYKLYKLFLTSFIFRCNFMTPLAHAYAIYKYKITNK